MVVEEPIISLQSVTKIYRRSHLGKSILTTGVKDITISIGRGEVFGLLGLNGSGKTTTIKLVLGLLFPTKGRVEVLGYPVPHPVAQKKIGYLPEVPTFYRNLSPYEVLRMYCTLSGIPDKEQDGKIRSALKMMKIDHVIHTPMREFSKGMLQRVGLAQAIIHDPDILVLDEPVTGLDPLGIRQSRELVMELNKKGKTIFFSSHSISELERLADRVGVLVEGKLVRLLEKSEWAEKSGRLEELFIETLETSGGLLVR